MTTAQLVIDRVRQLVNDSASDFITDVRWSDEELLLWITDAQREVVKTKPEAYPVTAVFSVDAGMPRQRLDVATAYRLIRVEANVVVDGMDSTYGDVVRIVERDVFDAFTPTWTSFAVASADNYYKAYCMDANDPLAFWLFPVPVANRDVWVTYAGIPALLTVVGDTLALSDMYLTPVVDYTVYRALTKEAREANRDVAERYLRSFYAALGVHRPLLMSIGQNATRPPEAAA